MIEIRYIGIEIDKSSIYTGFEVYRGYIDGMLVFTLYYKPDIVRADLYVQKPISYEDAKNLFDSIKDDLRRKGINHVLELFNIEDRHINLIHSNSCKDGQCMFLIRKG